MLRLTAGLIATLAVMGTLAACDRRTSGCGSLKELVDRASPGALIDLPDGCVYREAVTIKKPLTLKGSPGTEIRGSEV
jgi:hypothetical protein